MHLLGGSQTGGLVEVDQSGRAAPGSIACGCDGGSLCLITRFCRYVADNTVRQVLGREA